MQYHQSDYGRSVVNYDLNSKIFKDKKIAQYRNNAKYKYVGTWLSIQYTKFFRWSHKSPAKTFDLITEIIQSFLYSILAWIVSPLFSLYKKWSFPLRISSVNVTKAAVYSEFGPMENFNFCAVFALLFQVSLLKIKVLIILDYHNTNLVLW